MYSNLVKVKLLKLNFEQPKQDQRKLHTTIDLRGCMTYIDQQTLKIWYC